VLMVSSYLPELMGTCDRIAVMCRGVLGPARPVGELDEHQIMIEATGAVAEIAKLGPLIGLIFVFFLFTVLTTPWHLMRTNGLWETINSGTFCNLSNVELIFRQTAVVGIAALGMTLIIIAGGIDLSVGSAIAVICVS